MAFKSGFVSILGKPNVGKSSMVNAIIGEKVSITSPKPQTTRNKILGIHNTPNYQMVFVDTPGVQNTKTALGEYMSKASTSGGEGSDAIVILLDATSVNDTDYNLIKKYQNAKVPVYVVVNKIDLSSFKKLYPVLDKLNKFDFVKKFFTISALKKQNLDILLEDLENCLPEGEPLYPTDTYTDRPIKFIAAEIIREKALLYLQQEIPHGIAVEITKFDEAEDSTKIEADIICESERHKKIIIGAGGSMLKKIGMSARVEISNALDSNTSVKLFVKVKPNWRDSKYLLSDLGYNDKDL